VLFRTRPRNFDEPSLLGNRIFQSVSSVSKNNVAIQRLINQEYREELPVTSTVPNNEILLGCTDEEFTIPATLPYNGKSFGMVIIAGKGDGKTQWLKHFSFSQLLCRFKYNLFLLDPKYDFGNLDKPMKQPELVERLARYSITPRGFDAIFYKPAYFCLDDRRGKEYVVTLRDFESLEFIKRAEAMKEFFNLEDRTPAKNALDWILSKRVPKTLRAFKELIGMHKQFILKERKEAGSHVKMVSAAMDIALRQKIDMGLLGEEGQKMIIETDDQGKPTKTKTHHRADFVVDLVKNKVVVLEADLDMKRSYISSCYLNISLAQMWTDRKSYVETKGKQGLLATPTFAIIDECDVLCPHEREKRSPSRDQLIQFLSKGRAYGWGVIGITQQSQMMSQEFIRHCDYLVTTRLRSTKLEQLIKEKYSLEDYVIKDLKNLDYDINKPYKQWALLTGNPSNPVITFYPLPPQSAIQQERSQIDAMNESKEENEFGDQIR